jgi:hypothetical protein
MDCKHIEEFLQQHPGAALPAEALKHAQGCRACAELIREQASLELALRDLPEVQLPPYFQARLWGRINQVQPAPKSFRLRPAMLSLAAATAMILAAVTMVIRYPTPVVDLYSGTGTVPKPEVQVPSPQSGSNNVVTAASAGPRQVYPVWPGNQDAVEDGDLNIVASFYPAAGPRDEIKVLIDDQALSKSSYQPAGDYVTITPGDMAPGQHNVTVAVRTASGQETVKKWSFYLLEGRS